MREVTDVDSFVGPAVGAVAVDVVVEEVALVARSVGEDEHPLAVLLAVGVLAVVLGVVGPLLGSSAMLLVVLPLAGAFFS